MKKLKGLIWKNKQTPPFYKCLLEENLKDWNALYGFAKDFLSLINNGDPISARPNFRHQHLFADAYLFIENDTSVIIDDLNEADRRISDLLILFSFEYSLIESILNEDNND